MTKKKVTAKNYRSDPVFQAVVRAVVGILEKDKVVRPIDVMQRIGWLSADDLREWRFGRVPYLERVIRCNLPKLGRFLRVLAFYCEEIRLEPSHTAYVRHGKAHARRSASRSTGMRTSRRPTLDTTSGNVRGRSRFRRRNA